MLSCPLCCQSCFSSVDLLRTTLISILNRPLICPICSDVQHSLADLAAHLTKHIEVPSQIGSESRDANNVIHINTESGPNYDMMQECDGSMTGKLVEPVSIAASEVISSDPANANPIDEIARPFVCNLCNCSFRSKELQRMHMQLVHEINVRPSNQDTKARGATLLQCSLCPKRFKMIGSLRLHVRMVHGVSHTPQKQRNADERQPRTGNELEIGTGEVIASCNPPLAAHPTDYFSNYEQVTFGTHDSSAADPNDGNNNSKETIVAEDRVHKCDICDKCFTTKYFLKKHKRLHTGEMPYTCELCHRTFTFQQSYHRHLSYHTNDRPHSCSICGQAFKELSTLHNHQRIHSGEKPFECETCGKCFRQRVSYLVHRRIHTGVMPYTCLTCDKKFRYKISLRTHKCSGFMGNEHLSTSTDPKPTFMENEQTCSQSLDELITESCNRMGIVDQNDANHCDSSYANRSTENGNIEPVLHFECDSFNLNDLGFCETASTDLANVTPSMNEIFPQIELMSALYDNGDLQQFYDTTTHQL